MEKLLTPAEMAERLRVPKSWIYGKTRQRGPGSIPVVRVGRHCRFFEDQVFDWLASQNKSS